MQSIKIYFGIVIFNSLWFAILGGYGEDGKHEVGTNLKNMLLNLDANQPVDDSTCIHTVLLSKNRASQLHLLFKTMDIYYPEWNNQPSTVIVTASTEKLRLGYKLLQRMYKRVLFYWQQDEDLETEEFKTSIYRILQMSQCELVHLQCDDYIFVNPVTNNMIINKFIKHGNEVQSVSLALHPGLRKGIYGVEWLPPATFVPPELYWEPENEKHEWNFQGEMSSSVWRRLDILHIIRKADFPSPNWFEQALHFYSAVYKLKVQSPSSRFRRISTAFDMPIALHIDLNAAKTNETHDTLFDSRSNKFDSRFSLENVNDNFLNGVLLDINVKKCNFSISICNGASAVSFSPFSPVELKVLEALQQRSKNSDRLTASETYMQNQFFIDFNTINGLQVWSSNNNQNNNANN